MPVLAALAILALSFLAYSPVLPGAFIMDDLRLVRSDNPLLNGQLTPATIWFQTDFPLSNLAFWLEWNLWGNNPAGYHVVGIALHALSAILIWRLLAQLKIRGAWLAGILFALHPVCVNSVARIAEIKNTLSLPFFLLSVMCYLRYDAAVLHPPAGSPRESRRSGTLFYTLSLVTFTLALLSKTSTVMLPMVLLACGAWQREKLTRRDLLHATPHFALALTFGLMSVWFQKHQALALAGETLAPSTFLERFAVAGRVFWFYLGKALLPLNLNLIYPQWKVAPHAVIAFAPWVFVLIAVALCWRFRQSWGRHVLFGVGCFAITLFPALGFFDAQFLTRWQVSDHLQYLPMVCIVALTAAIIASLLKRTPYLVGSGVLVAILLALGWQRAGVYASEENLMRDSLAKNPTASEAHNDLGTILAKRNELSDAIFHFAAAVEANPRNAAAHLNLAQGLAIRGDVAQAKSHLLTALEIKPADATSHVQLANVLSREGQLREARMHLEIALRFKPSAATHLQLAGLLYPSGQVAEATRHLRKAVDLDPNSPEALNNLAWLLATCFDEGIRNEAEAVRCAERACELTRYKHSGFMSTLAAAYAEAGRFQEAIGIAEAALAMQSAAGDLRLASISRQLLECYRAGKAYHEPGRSTAQM